MFCPATPSCSNLSNLSVAAGQREGWNICDDAHLFERPLVSSQGRRPSRPTPATDLVRTSPHLVLQPPELSNNRLTLPNLLLQSAVFTNPSVLAIFLSMHSQGLNFGTFPGQALDLPGGSQFGYAPTDDSYCLFATQPYTPAPSTPLPATLLTLLPGAPTAAWRICMRRRQHQSSTYAGQLHCFQRWDNLFLPRDARTGPVTYYTYYTYVTHRAQPSATSAGTRPHGKCHC